MAKGADNRSIPMSPPGVVTLIRQSVPEDTILCLDNGLYKVCFSKQSATSHMVYYNVDKGISSPVPAVKTSGGQVTLGIAAS